jgi:hypothetical protein
MVFRKLASGVGQAFGIEHPVFLDNLKVGFHISEQTKRSEQT